MFDTMTLTKITGGVCGTLLVFLLGNWAAELIYEGSHGKDHAASYVIDTGEDEDEGGDVVEVAFADVYAAADAGKGERVFGKCRACHKLGDGENGVGPHLYAVVDRQIGAIGGFAYSGSLADLSAEAWTPENLNGFLENPKGWAPGTKMAFNGLPKIEDRANLIAYLQTIGQ